MKKFLTIAVAAAVSSAVLAAPASRTRKAAAQNDASSQQEKDFRVAIDQFPKTGRQSTLDAPSIAGGSIIGRAFNKPRKWIVLEAKYTTYAKWQDNLTFTWHVLLETKSATEKDKTDKIPPYSYFTTSVTYQNVPKGTHAASVCLHPSNLERYGEPKAIGLVIANSKGDVLYSDSESEIQGVKKGTRFWEDDKIMNAKTSDGGPMIERRQGLVDRSKTIWALVNPNDYEQVVQ